MPLLVPNGGNKGSRAWVQSRDLISMKARGVNALWWYSDSLPIPERKKERQIKRVNCIYLKSTETIKPFCGLILMVHIYWALPLLSTLYTLSHFLLITSLWGMHYPFSMMKKLRVIVVELGSECRESDSRVWMLNHSLDCLLGAKRGRKHLPKIILMEGCLESMQICQFPQTIQISALDRARTLANYTIIILTLKDIII